MIKTRKFLEHNYFSVWNNGKTIRFQIEDDKPITELDFPEFYDVKITGKCSGKCPWCYMDSKEDAEHYPDIVDRANKFFGITMSQNERPFQVAIGGGNPNEHPDFIRLLEYFDSVGIVPNYTTNGMGVSVAILQATQKYCGGVAVSMHPHLEEHWSKAIAQFWTYGVENLNAHLIISDRESIDFFKRMYYRYNSVIKYFVLLPYEAAGRAEPKEIDYEYLTEVLNGIDNIESIAFGAGFFSYLQSQDFPVSLYEPEIMSKFLDMKDMKLYKSSFNLTQVPSHLERAIA